MVCLAVAHIVSNQRIREAVLDLHRGLIRWELWGLLGWNDIRQRYRRSMLGPFWITLSMAAMIGGIGYMYAGLFGQKLDEYIVYLAAGVIVFSLISSVVVDGTQVFITSARAILQTRAPISIYVYQMVWKNILIFGHNILIHLILLIALQVKVGAVLLLALAGLVIIIINSIWLALILGGLSARFRDVPPTVASLIQLAFFLTPIFWKPDQLPNRLAIVDLNPLYYFVEVVRMPLMGQVPPASIWWPILTITCVGGLVALSFFAKFRTRIPYWV